MADRNADFPGPRINGEKDTVEKMIRYYCKKKHVPDADTLCPICSDLLVYSHGRLDHCQFSEDKPSCRKCTVHCYRPTMRDNIRKVMRFSGPRLLFRAPAEWIRHWRHERKNRPDPTRT
ncbi:MAG: nitrous oxide-stimulated promoter family protein [Candidatus Thorarchaeota archaeon]|jgi:hypothetical protein